MPGPAPSSFQKLAGEHLCITVSPIARGLAWGVTDQKQKVRWRGRVTHAGLIRLTSRPMPPEVVAAVVAACNGTIDKMDKTQRALSKLDGVSLQAGPGGLPGGYCRGPYKSKAECVKDRPDDLKAAEAKELAEKVDGQWYLADYEAGE